MFRIAICDDEKTICAQIENMLLEYSKLSFLEMDIEVFLSGEELCRFVEEKHGFDLIYLDIEMDIMNGIEVGNKIRKILKDYKTEIVYVSGKDSYDRQLFDLQPLNFILKPIKSNKVIENFNLAILRAEKSNNTFIYKKKTEVYKIPMKDIIYFEGFGKQVKIITTNNIDTFYRKIYDVLKNVASHQFINIHRSYIINYMHTTIFKYDEVTMSNGVRLPISQSKRKEIKQNISRLESEVSNK